MQNFCFFSATNFKDLFEFKLEHIVNNNKTRIWLTQAEYFNGGAAKFIILTTATATS